MRFDRNFRSNQAYSSNKSVNINRDFIRLKSLGMLHVDTNFKTILKVLVCRWTYLDSFQISRICRKVLAVNLPKPNNMKARPYLHFFHHWIPLPLHIPQHKPRFSGWWSSTHLGITELRYDRTTACRLPWNLGIFTVNRDMTVNETLFTFVFL